MKKKKRKTAAEGYLFVMPATLIVLLVTVYPLVRGILVSFTNTNFLYPQKAKFVGLKNIIDIFKDKEFISALGFTIFFAVSSVVLIYLIGLALALLLNREFKGKGLFRAIMLLPWVIPNVVASNMWLWMLNDQTGMINLTLLKLGIIKEPILFLATPFMAKISTVIVNTWKSFPFMLLVLMAAMQNIPKELYESASMDGANAFQRFKNITLPMIKPVSITSTVLIMIWSFNNFETVFLLTEGGPASATSNISIYMYNSAFFRNQMGYASAIALVMLVFMIVLSSLYQYVLNRKED